MTFIAGTNQETNNPLASGGTPRVECYNHWDIEENAEDGSIDQDRKEEQVEDLISG